MEAWLNWLAGIGAARCVSGEGTRVMRLANHPLDLLPVSLSRGFFNWNVCMQNSSLPPWRCQCCDLHIISQFMPRRWIGKIFALHLSTSVQGFLGAPRRYYWGGDKAEIGELILIICWVITFRTPQRYGPSGRICWAHKRMITWWLRWLVVFSARIWLSQRDLSNCRGARAPEASGQEEEKLLRAARGSSLRAQRSKAFKIKRLRVS